MIGSISSRDLGSALDMLIARIDTSARGWRGLSRGKTARDFDPVELRRGAKVELEHVKNVSIAKRIAMDHLIEDPLYYRKIARLHLASARRSPEETRQMGRPPKFWMKRCMDSVLKKSRSKRDPRALCGWVWYHHMSDDRRRLVLEEEARLERVAKKKAAARKRKSKSIFRALLGW